MRKLLLAATAVLALGGAVYAADDGAAPQWRRIAPPPASNIAGHQLKTTELKPIAQMDTPYGPMIVHVLPSSRHDFTEPNLKGLVVVALNNKHDAGMAIVAKFDCEKHLFGFLHMFTIKVDEHGSIGLDEEMPLNSRLTDMTPTTEGPWGAIAEKFACNADYKLPKFESGQEL